MNGFDAIAALEIAGIDDIVLYNPVSKLAHSTGTSSAANAAPLGMDILWDNGDEMTWDNDTNIGMEA